MEADKNADTPIDNIASDDTTQSAPQPPLGTIVNLNEALDIINRHYGGSLKSLILDTQQLMDGALVKFRDVALNIVAATARLRTLNAGIVGPDGILYIRTGLSDLTFGKTYIGPKK